MPSLVVEEKQKNIYEKIRNYQKILDRAVDQTVRTKELLFTMDEEMSIFNRSSKAENLIDMAERNFIDNSRKGEELANQIIEMQFKEIERKKDKVLADLVREEMKDESEKTKFSCQKSRAIILEEFI
jgi:hypothetical protein